MSSPPPRLYAMLAARAPVAVVFRRGPTDWWMIGRWDLETGDFCVGAWLRGRLYARRCDVSPDGELLYAFIDKSVTRGFEPLRGRPYHTISKVPWLAALAAWTERCGTWTRGFHFVEGPGAKRIWDIGEPDAGDARPVRNRFGLAVTRVEQYAAERRRGWVEDELSPARDRDGDFWDEKRSAILTKPRPGGGARLLLEDRGHDFRERIEGRRPDYWVERAGSLERVPGAVWADWDPAGRLIVATLKGRLEIRDPDAPDFALMRAHDLSALEPTPGPPPEWATRW